MDDIKLVRGYGAVESQIGPFSFLTFDLVREFTVLFFRDTHGDTDRCGVRLILEGDAPAGRLAIAYQFDDVSDLRYKREAINIVGLAMDHREPKLGLKRWRVYDYENSSIQFEAETASVQLLPANHVKQWYLGWPGCMDD
jgi:hypothetical protein